ncbi:4-hydroxy-tetrahydrodipicolinate synthase [Chromobacterium alticapitis]|uniref:4-hydroxy-tetrahydrodipicolinate synthase n=1 Tax=Chromobacterium alticapitis TaxID=2073169 RepID=A0A2S5DFW3_9NEIS|nr:4-hydroxy-tetrahydrodipicolinate synthase [Chromobacterium alticapitis]POZ61878.1 4-hydroxy-tetrahydrodipicolinate synthase [Chromobacterium alticapitis]
MARYWGKVLTAMVTPFDVDARVNLDMACRLARRLADTGSDALVLAATTGEAPTLSDDERFELIRAVSEAVTIPVLAGTGSNDTRHALALTARAEAAGAAGVFLVAPYYNRPPQAGIEAHFRALAAATQLPVMLYDVPGRTGRRIAHEVLLRLFREIDNIVAFKDATGDPAAAARLVAEAGDHFELYSGDDALTLPLLAVGAVGVVGTSTHWTGLEFAEMIAAFEQGDVTRARAVNAALQPSFAFSNTDDSVFSMSVKAMLRSQGLAVGECRLPLPPAPAGVEQRAAQVWQDLQAWRARQR